jgi:hypothetical protein
MAELHLTMERWAHMMAGNSSENRMIGTPGLPQTGHKHAQTNTEETRVQDKSLVLGSETSDWTLDPETRTLRSATCEWLLKARDEYPKGIARAARLKGRGSPLAQTPDFHNKNPTEKFGWIKKIENG